MRSILFIEVRVTFSTQNKNIYNYFIPEKVGPRFPNPTSLFDDCRFRNDDYILVLHLTDFADEDGIKTNRGEGEWGGGEDGSLI